LRCLQSGLQQVRQRLRHNYISGAPTHGCAFK
jgi:hypothetical protein